MKVERYWNPQGASRALLLRENPDLASRIHAQPVLTPSGSPGVSSGARISFPRYPAELLTGLEEGLRHENEDLLLHMAWEISRWARSDSFTGPRFDVLMKAGKAAGPSLSEEADEETGSAGRKEAAALIPPPDPQRAVLFLSWLLLRGRQGGSTRLSIEPKELRPKLRQLGANSSDLKAVEGVLATARAFADWIEANESREGAGELSGPSIRRQKRFSSSDSSSDFRSTSTAGSEPRSFSGSAPEALAGSGSANCLDSEPDTAAVSASAPEREPSPPDLPVDDGLGGSPAAGQSSEAGKAKARVVSDVSLNWDDIQWAGACVVGHRSLRLPLVIEGTWISIQRLFAAEERLAQGMMSKLLESPAAVGGGTGSQKNTAGRASEGGSTEGSRAIQGSRGHSVEPGAEAESAADIGAGTHSGVQIAERDSSRMPRTSTSGLSPGTALGESGEEGEPRALDEAGDDREKISSGGLVEEPKIFVLPDPAEVERALTQVLNNSPEVAGARIELSDEQRQAVRGAASRRLSFITGGPGTGKTSIVVSLLRVLTRLGLSPSEIALSAPTGKAANRMEEAARNHLLSIKERSTQDQALLEKGLGARTLHRLLGYSPSGDRFRHHRGHPLPEKVVVVDEASMIDLTLMDRLVRAVAPDAMLILLGDADQLPSVDVGAVFRDLVDESTWSKLRLSPVELLSHSYRMDPSNPEGKAILTVANTINVFRGREESSVLDEPAFAESLRRRPLRSSAPFKGAEFIELAAEIEPDKGRENGMKGDRDTVSGGVLSPGLAEGSSGLADAKESFAPSTQERGTGTQGYEAPVQAQYREELESFLRQWWSNFLDPRVGILRSANNVFTMRGGEFSSEDVQVIRGILSHYNRQRILCVTREQGVGSSGAVNRLFQNWRAQPDSHRKSTRITPALEAGEPVMFVANDYTRSLFNGDQGVVVRVRDGNRIPVLMAVFPQGDKLRAHPLAALGHRLQPCYAMTVHKSQGSEFDTVALILPDEEVAILTREILYTAITRAKQAAVVVGRKELLETGIKKGMERLSGVADRLREIASLKLEQEV